MERNIYTERDREIGERYSFMMRMVQVLGEVALSMINKEEVEVEIKPDSSKVTTVDKRLNRQFIEATEVYCPDDVVWGEEESNEEKGDPEKIIGSRWLWLIDPIDGTGGFWRSYQNRRFNECHSTIMVTGFEPNKEVPTMSVIYNPFQEQAHAVSTVNNKVYHHTSDARRISADYMDGTPKRLAHMREIHLDRRQTPNHLRDVRRFERNEWWDSTPDLSRLHETMPYGRQVDHQLFMASVALGDVDLSTFPGPSHPHDVAPGALIVHNAGGDVRTFKNETFEEVDWRKDPINGVIASTHPGIGEEVAAWANLRVV